MELPLISTRNLVKTYELDELKLPVLKGVNLEVKEGEMVSIMGPSGCGKSTLMHLLGLLDTPTSGQILFEGQDVSRYSEAARADFRGDKVGFVFQSFNLLKKFSALENVVLPLIYSHRGKGSEKRAKELLKQVGLKERINHLTSKLSGGEQQRVAIARSLINDPPLILADEPTGNLDSLAGAEIMNLLKDLNRGGKTLVIVTHDFNIAQNCERIVKMKDGQIVD
ncbi:MAG: ABC transporter ATP-binding protein [Patescibacteria group bacterium]|nr:ABC transporter ATP-binding protein [Patescibacteria group bacterium]